ncbi:hypothetical protein FZC66_04710 [Priestia megaterium]|nr:hypothetical protein FZC66_04710 [Priestia megaterium]
MRYSAFYIIRYVLVLYAVVFSLIFVSAVPVAFGFHVTLQQESSTAGIPEGALVVFKKHSAINKNDLLLVEEPTLSEKMIKTANELEGLDKTTGYDTVTGTYVYHIPYLGFVLTPLKMFAIPFMIGSILVLLFTYSLEKRK